MFEYRAHFDEAELSAAERTFYIRSLRELKFWRTVLAPVAFVSFLLLGVVLKAPTYFFWLFGAFFALSVVGPLAFYVLRPRAAAADARKSPYRQIWVEDQAVRIRRDSGEFVIPWEKVRRVWDTGPYLLLVLSPVIAIHLPKKDMPVAPWNSFSQKRGRPPNHPFQRMGVQRGRTVLAMDCVLAGAQCQRWPAAELDR